MKFSFSRALRSDACSKLSLLVLFGFIAGCGANSVRLETAGAVTQSANYAVSQSRAAIAAARSRRLEANIAFVAANPSCQATISQSIYLSSPELRPRTGNRQRPRNDVCVKPVAGAEYTEATVDFAPPTDKELAGLIALLTAVAEYSDAMAKIVERPNTDISMEINSVLEKAQLAAGLLGALGTGDGASSAVSTAEGAATGPAGVAAIELLEFVTQLAEEQRKNDELRALMTEKGGAFDEAAAKASDALARFNTTFAVADAATTANFLEDAYDEYKLGVAYPARAVMARAVLTARYEEHTVAAAAQALSKAWTDLVMTHAELRNELLQGEFDEARAKKVAAASRKNILKALGLIAAAATEFGAL